MSLESAPDRSYDVPPADECKGKAKADGDHYLGKLIAIHGSTLTRYPAGTMAPPRQKNVAGIAARLSERGTVRVAISICWSSVGCRAAKMHRSLWRTIRARAWVRAPGAAKLTPAGRAEELKRPPGNIRRPPGLKISWFRKAPSAPGAADLHWLAIMANRNCCSHRRNKQVVAVRTHNSGFYRVANGHARIGLLPASAC
jgi:hypothetical protein